MINRLLEKHTSFKYFFVSVKTYLKYAITFGFREPRARRDSRSDSLTRPRTILTRSFGFICSVIYTEG